LFKREILPGLQARIPDLRISDPFGDTVDEIKENLHVRFNHGLKRCHVGLFHTVIQSNGNVIPCCYAPDTFVMGNAFRDEGVSSAWTGKQYTEFRSACKSGGLFPMCKSCRQYVYLNQAVDRLLEGPDS
jgi:radical SAM protein with 4Fe4S-binding SPASM domain